MTSKTVSDLELALVYNNQIEYPTLNDVAKELGLSVKTVKNRVGILRAERKYNIEHDLDLTNTPILVSRQSKAEDEDGNPISEKPQLYMEHWTAEDCISHLRRFKQMRPETHITRNMFNNESGISESTWNRYFGKFEQYKRSAGLQLNRGAHRLELDISKHAGLDGYRAMNEQKAGYEGKYKKERGGRDKSVVVMTDIHDKECDPFVRRLYIEACKRVQPDVIFLNGDIWDAPEFGKYTQDPREWDLVGRIKWVHDFLADLREVAPDSEIRYLEGNHEFRLLRHLSDTTPALKTILADLHGFTVPKLLGLDKYEVNYIAKADLAVINRSDFKREIGRNFDVLWGQLCGNHFPEGAKLGLPGWNGHHHSHHCRTHYNVTFGAYEWHQIGAGHMCEASYTNGEKWTNGLLIANTNLDTRSTCFEHVSINDIAWMGGVRYGRRQSEVWHSGQMVMDDKHA